MEGFYGIHLFDEIIKNAAYPKDQVERIPQEIFEKYFVPAEQDEYFRLIDEITRVVTFQKHDLLSLLPVAHDFGLILCKNVLLHFNESQRNKGKSPSGELREANDYEQ